MQPTEEKDVDKLLQALRGEAEGDSTNSYSSPNTSASGLHPDSSIKCNLVGAGSRRGERHEQARDFAGNDVRLR